MAQNFLGCDRDQVFLLPPSVDDWLPADHFARFVIAAVEEMDLSAFYGDYRADGHGRPAHDPAMMVALLVYAYARGQRSSRVIERACIEDIAVRVIAANRRPDHCTIARFRQRHEAALAGVFGDVLALCAQAGLAGVEVLAVDGTKVHATRLSGPRATTSSSLASAWMRRRRSTRPRTSSSVSAAATSCRASWPARRAARSGWPRPNAAWTRNVSARRARSRRRVRRGSRKPSGAWKKSSETNAPRTPPMRARARGVMKNGRGFGSPPKPYRPPEQPTGKINLSDPDSRNVKTPRGWVQGYNAQAVCNAHQIVLGAEISLSSAEFGLLGPMISAAERELTAAGITR